MTLIYQWASRSDLKVIADIDAFSFFVPLCREELEGWIRRANSVVLTARDGDNRILGFIIWLRWRDRYVVHRLAVHPHLRRRGIGTGLMRRLLAKPRTVVGYSEVNNLPTCLFFKSLGFQARAQTEMIEDQEYYIFELCPFSSLPLDDCEAGSVYWFRESGRSLFSGIFLGIKGHSLLVGTPDGRVVNVKSCGLRIYEKKQSGAERTEEADMR